MRYLTIPLVLGYVAFLSFVGTSHLIAEVPSSKDINKYKPKKKIEKKDEEEKKPLFKTIHERLKKVECLHISEFLENIIVPGKYQVAFFSTELYEKENLIKITFANSKRHVIVMHYFDKQGAVCVMDDYKDTQAAFSFNIFDPEAEKL